MWFPTLLQRMEQSNASSVCEASGPINHTTSHCHITDQNQVYFETFLQAVSSLPGNIIYLLLVDILGRKWLTSEYMEVV